jgi:hypothetical protein
VELEADLKRLINFSQGVFNMGISRKAFEHQKDLEILAKILIYLYVFGNWVLKLN